MVTPLPAVTRVSPEQLGTEGLCPPPEACSGGDAAAATSLLLWAGVAAVVAVAVGVRIRRAREELAEERSRTVDERDAFDRFVDRVAAIDVGSTGPAPQAAGGAVATAPHATTPDDGTEEVVDRYRETVMATDHFAEDYDESLAENLRAELGADVTAGLLGGTALTPPLKRGVVQHGVAAREQREEWLRTLDREDDRLRTARDRLADIEADRASTTADAPAGWSFADCSGAWHRLGDLVDDCRAVLTDRQETIHDGQPVGPRVRETETVYAYLYGSLDVTYPVLADGTELLDRLRTDRGRVLDALTRRV